MNARSIHGNASSRFAAVADAFAANFSEGLEVGAALCLYVDGVPVVDLWGGLADPHTGKRWGSRTMQIVFSTTKGVTALCVLRLVERGAIELDASVARYWPEFAANGKEPITVRMLLSHRAGLPSLDRQLSLSEVLQGDAVVRALESQTPIWPPGSKHGYHGHTFGWLLGALVLRVTGLTIGQFLREEIAGPLSLDLWIGLPEAEEHRVARLIEPTMAGASAPFDETFVRMLTVNGALAGSGDTYPWNTQALHAAELPAVNGIASAHGLARLYAATLGDVDGHRVIDRHTAAIARREESLGVDAMIGAETRFGLGFLLHSTNVGWLGPNAFGSAGAGGSFAFADPDSGVAMAYVANRMGAEAFLDPRAKCLIEAARQALV